MQGILQYLRRRGFECIDSTYYGHISNWLRWYQGKVIDFHTYKQYNGRCQITRERKSLGMAKSIAEDWANLALNEKLDITIAEKRTHQIVSEVLERNQFKTRANQLVEKAFALGTGAFVEYKENNETRIDYVRGSMIYPLTWHNGEIRECAFASMRTANKQQQLYLNIHRLENNQYVIENHMFTVNGETLGGEIDLPPDVEDEYRTYSDIPMFQIIRPNIVNNIDLDNPMGISVFANAIDQLKGIDLVYDSYCNEFRLGKKRITIPMSRSRIAMEEDGSARPVFDDNDTEFYAVPETQNGENKITEHNMELRYQAHEAGLQTGLNLLSYKCGLGKDRYNFQDGQVKTATEVVSEKSDLFQNLKKHELVLRNAIIGMVKAIEILEGLSTEPEITVNFDDSIIEDVGAEKQRFLQEIRDGVRQKWEYRVKFFGEDETTAKSMIEEEEPDPFGFSQDGDD